MKKQLIISILFIIGIFCNAGFCCTPPPQPRHCYWWDVYTWKPKCQSAPYQPPLECCEGETPETDTCCRPWSGEICCNHECVVPPPNQACCDKKVLYSTDTQQCCGYGTGKTCEKDECCIDGGCKDCCKTRSDKSCESRNSSCGCDPIGTETCDDHANEWTLGSANECYSECGGTPCTGDAKPILVNCYATQSCMTSFSEYDSICMLGLTCGYTRYGYCEPCISYGSAIIIQKYSCQCP